MNSSIRSKFQRAAVAATAILALAGPALCTTWIVDQANGPGTHFTDIPPAISAAAAGDVIIVRAGNYSGFTLSSGLTILGQGLVLTSGDISVTAVPAGQTAAVVRVVHVNNRKLEVTNCAGTILLQETHSQMLVQGSSDIRILQVNGLNAGVGVTGKAGLHVLASRVQVVQSTFEGDKGTYGSCSPYADGGFGGPGLYFSGAVNVHFALSTALGGTGGNGGGSCNPYAGDGGSGIRGSVYGPARLILTGGGVGKAVGGFAGGSWAYPGDSLALGTGTAWTSGMTYLPTPPYVYGGSTLITTPAMEPTLELIGTPAPGSTITLRLRGEPGMAVRFNVGRTPKVEVTPGVLVDQLMFTDSYSLPGSIPASGVIDTAWQFRRAAKQGSLLIFQARVVDASGGVHRSNSIEAIVR